MKNAAQILGRAVEADNGLDGHRIKRRRRFRKYLNFTVCIGIDEFVSLVRKDMFNIILFSNYKIRFRG